MKQKTDTKAADETLVDYQSQVEALNRLHCILDLNLDGMIITANSNFLELTGYTLEEIKGKHYHVFLDPAHINGAGYQAIWESIQQGDSATEDCKWLNKKENEIWLQACYNVIQDKTGKPVRIMLIARDVTSDTVKRLTQETEYKVLTDILNITSIVSYADLSGHITDINEKFVRVSKYSREELIGSSHNITRHPDMPKATFKQVWNTIGHGKIFRGMIKNRAKDGTPYYVDAVIAPILGRNGKPKKYIGVRYDITEQEIERQNMKGILAAIDASYAYIEFDPDGYVLTVNQNFLQLLEYQKEEIVGKHHRMFVESGYAKSHAYNQFWVDLKNGQNQSDAFRRITKSDGEIWTQGVYAPVKDEIGRVIKVVMIATDITQQVSTNVDYKNRVKGYSEFISKVANGDLRRRVDAEGSNELSVIGGSLNAMVESLTGITHQIGEANDTLLVALGQIQSTVNTQAAGASQQAAAVGEITVTLEEVRSTSAQNLVKTKQLGEVAERVRREGVQGQQILEQAVAGMEVIRERVENIAHTILALSEQTQQIGEITNVVSNIAQQSKMLALNASIEAAKAGEAGKGFAVVAAEVKELAIQSQQSTAQVQKILQDIRRATDRAVMATEEGNKRVDAGVVLVEKSGEMMKQLSEVIDETVRASKQIVAAVQQGVVGIDQVSTSMNEINKVTSQFVSSTQQTKDAAANMGKVAERLKECVSIYKT
ncbi:methyl-accepting chemotaxis sensory transducer with Pas/Pac sensor [Nitrosomonas sp. Nm84]|uniref:methyl-accepting chemotaxis protein n=1 Tax=Nitrosomonas sp. Nm84 TaxID=200124 RepID=UPI000D775BF3|nr:PAS domain-containing protein [Nitrosomonas sp. Nm84]PXW86435.1 methyl-accepting chemotaxis sensory transducer with Pas/Pac sensor [Nitrosomonas sp. Nm84]